MKRKDVKELCCPICGKVIGEEWCDGYMSAGSLGAIRFMDHKIDYRKASHVYDYKHHANLCRKCAKEAFPEGKRWKVCFKGYGHGENNILGGKGIDGNGFFKHYADAENACKECNAKNNGCIYYIKEYSL